MPTDLPKRTPKVRASWTGQIDHESSVYRRDVPVMRRVEGALRAQLTNPDACGFGEKPPTDPTQD